MARDSLRDGLFHCFDKILYTLWEINHFKSVSRAWHPPFCFWCWGKFCFGWREWDGRATRTKSVYGWESALLSTGYKPGPACGCMETRGGEIEEPSLRPPKLHVWLNQLLTSLPPIKSDGNGLRSRQLEGVRRKNHQLPYVWLVSERSSLSASIKDRVMNIHGPWEIPMLGTMVAVYMGITYRPGNTFFGCRI